MQILALSGSLRTDSFNTALLKAAREILADVEWIWGSIDLPVYNEELDAQQKPAGVQRLLEQTAQADALIIATPEYNYGVPGGLKNAIDWLSRPAYKSALRGKPTLIMSAAMSASGGIRAQGQLKQVLGGTLTPVFPAPELAIGSAHLHFQNGRLTEEAYRKNLDRLLRDFREWVKV